MQKLRIKLLDSIHCRALDRSTIAYLRPLISYEQVTTRIERHGPVHKSKRVYLISSKGLFPSGILPKISEYAKTKGDELSIEGWGINKLPFPDRPSTLPNIAYKPYQMKAISEALFQQRGIIHAPARSGKTVIGGGVIQSIPDVPFLFIVNTKDIFYQTVEEFQKFRFDVGRMGDGKKEGYHQIVVGLYQTLKRYANVDYLSRFGGIIVDECHHARKDGGSYWKILMNSPAPLKIGLTATIPDDPGELLIMQCLLGPVIYSVSQTEAKEIGATVKAKLKIVKAPENLPEIKRLNYQEAYQHGVVENRALNRLVVREASLLIEKGNSVLVLVSRVHHGFNLEKIFNLLFPQYEVPFLCGGIDADTRAYLEFLKAKLIRLNNMTKVPIKEVQKTDTEICKIKELERDIREKSKNRNVYRHAFIKKEIPCVVATKIWNEGVNIPTLNAIINAAGGKKEIGTIQASSRSLTACEGKTEGVIVDIFNPLHKSFIEHFGHRISTYCDMGWL